MTKYIKCFGSFLTFSAVLISVGAHGQTLSSKTYSGKVNDSNGAALNAVEVAVMGTTLRTSSDRSGTFMIKCMADDSLVFKRDGYKELHVAAKDRTPLNIVLTAVNNTAYYDEIIDIPFGKRTRRELNYAISALKTDDLPKIPVSNLSSMLAGRFSGLLVQQTGNQPGTENFSFQVRGKSSYAQGANPVLLVDGVERDFSDMDLNEIESVTVLKDAAALNWYGLIGGNGVILVNTRHGKANQNYVNFDIQGGFLRTENLVRPLNSFDYATLYNQALTNAGQAPAYDQTALNAYRNGTDQYLYPNNNYIDRFLNRTAPVQRYAVSLGGGSDKIRYFTNVSYYDQNGLFKETNTDDYNSNTNYKRYNFRVNLDYEVTKTLSFSLLAGVRSERRNDPIGGGGGGTAAVLNSLFTLPPNAFPIQNQDGTYGGTSVYQVNPLGQLQNSGVYKAITNVLQATISAKQKLDFLTPGLSANVFFSYDNYGNYTNGFTQNYSVVNQTVTPAQTYRTPAILAYQFAGFGTSTKNNEIWAGFDYDRRVGDHKVNASVRAQQATSAAVDRIDYNERLFVARADYGYKNRYFLGFTGSYSGSENYAPGRRFGFFPAGTIGWLVSDEDFFKNKSPLSYLKLRASYGRSGNIGPTYDSNGNVVRLPYRALFTRGAGPILGSSFSSTTTAYEVSPTGNPLTTWEKIDRLNVGADLGLFNNSLNLSADYFNETRTDILGSANLPGILGVAVSAVNSGKVNSKGVDLNGIYQRSFHEVKVSINGNLTYAANKLLEQSLPGGTISYQSPVGYNIGNVASYSNKRFYVSDGLFQSQGQINASPKQSLSGLVVPGDIKYKDINGDNIIDSRDAIATNYTDIPNVYYGFGFNISYKLFDISTQFQGVSGRTVDIKSAVYAGPNTLNQLSLDAWTPATAATAKFPRLALSDNGNNNAASDLWLRSGNYLKLRTVELGLTLPKSFTYKLHMQRARFFVGGYNLLTFSKLKEFGIDPETPTAGRASNYPYVKTYTLGLNVKF
ncbi:SusC/RagA family TonB-linked outer membrane protein [Mucilaginibacter daejeonensis]|uniref:SusC/RagA family TonB-linked outer membrane protein n=1 Tax=Mucilaginibacter daejeonensis TaxID=398049 RepID=UPI001D175317|nr:SusC/RagA family TonB-linked outer membrane protein [Mucilaginibacter daejeonensis]UEG51665.1 SusC/RagA family TonB-linked outer membrane protein [Mucilaginibacter daejeonensis]